MDNEITRAVGYTAGGAALLKLAEILLRQFGVLSSARQMEMERTLEAAGKIREELRADNEKLRARVAALEARVTSLESEHHALLSENHDLKERLKIAEAQNIVYKKQLERF